VFVIKNNEVKARSVIVFADSFFLVGLFLNFLSISMNPEEILKKTASLEALLSTPCDRVHNEHLLFFALNIMILSRHLWFFVDEVIIIVRNVLIFFSFFFKTVAEELLPRYSLMKQISKCQSDVRSRKVNAIMLKIQKLRDDISTLMGMIILPLFLPCS